MARCPECGRVLRVRKAKTYPYRESGLESVLLTGVRVYRCPGCREAYPAIPNVVGLHRAIAAELARKPLPLTGAEFRFLRKELALKAKVLARHLGTTDVTLSRWESGNSPINPAADRLLRVLWTLQTVQKGWSVKPANFVQAFLQTFAKIGAAKRAKPLALRIPAHQRAPRPPQGEREALVAVGRS